MAKLLKRPHFEVINAHAIEYPTPINLNNFWNFGALAGICLGIQILTGVFLAMHYRLHFQQYSVSNKILETCANASHVDDAQRVLQ